MGVAVGVAVGDGVAVGVAVGIAVGVAVGSGVAVSVGSVKGVAVGVGVGVAVGVDVGINVGVDVGVGSGVGVTVAGGVEVRVAGVVGVDGAITNTRGVGVAVGDPITACAFSGGGWVGGEELATSAVGVASGVVGPVKMRRRTANDRPTSRTMSAPAGSHSSTGVGPRRGAGGESGSHCESGWGSGSGSESGGSCCVTAQAPWQADRLQASWLRHAP
ncbi:MAG: hypothetical protein QM692_08830 [Thermomicrobiales bacterium]